MSQMRFQWSSSILWEFSYVGYVKSKLSSTCWHSHALNCLVVPKNKLNISAYVSLCEVHRLLWSFEHVVCKPVHPMWHLNEFQIARAVTLIQDGWIFRCVAVDLNVFQLGTIPKFSKEAFLPPFFACGHTSSTFCISYNVKQNF